MNEELENNEGLEGEESSDFMGYEELMEARKISFEDVKEHMTGPVISTILHVILLAFLGTIIVFEAPEKGKEITVEMKTIEPQEIEPPPPPPEPPEPVEIENPTETPIERPNMEVEVNVQVDNISVDNPNPIDMPSMLNMKMSNSALSLAVPMGGGSGGAVGGRFLGTGGSGNKFVFMIDFSSSMSKQQTFVVKAHLIKALKAFQGKGQVIVLFFSRFVWLPEQSPSTSIPVPRWIVPTAKNIAVFEKHIVQEPGSGGTNWELPLRLALEMKDKPNVIFFMTDGAVGKGIVQNCFDLVEQHGKDVTINTIAFGMKGGGDLEKLAKMSKGGVFKGYRDSELAVMAAKLSLPTSFTSENAFDYSKPKSVKIKKEKAVTGLTIQ